MSDPRIAKLPKWAQVLLSKNQKEIAILKERLESERTNNRYLHSAELSKIIVDPYHAGTNGGKPLAYLPDYVRIRFQLDHPRCRWMEVSVDEDLDHGYCLKVDGDGELLVKPQSSNVVSIVKGRR